jgi:formamidopyrimidine-DNA glycosylase
MPELPEVELVTKSLDKLVSGNRIQTAELLRNKLAPQTPPKTFNKIFDNVSINFVHRRGKHILFDLDNKKTLIVHLRMSGRFMLLPFERENPKFAHAIFYFEDESRLVFQDQRHFGFMKLVDTGNLNKAKELVKLAPEPFSDEFSPKYFREVLNSSTRKIKEFLLDQTKVTGLGNIYVAESLFLARVHPQTPANKISTVKANRLHKFIKEVLAESIANGSTLNVDPENIDGSYYGGGYENHWRVYDRKDEPCINCGKKIKRIKQGGRSSYYCSRCQQK